MALEISKNLSKILGRPELDKISSETVEKIEKYIEERSDEILQLRALYETTDRTRRKIIFIILNFIFFFLGILF